MGWVDSCLEEETCLSALTFGELFKGIAKLPLSVKKESLFRWVWYDLVERFSGRILNIDFKIAKIWGEIQTNAEQKGKAMPAIDGLIAATGLTYNLIVVTRNTDDMKESGVTLLKPWGAGAEE